VYALLGMTVTKMRANTAQLHALEVNYEKTAAEVFQDVVRYVIRRDKSLAVLLLEASFGGQICDDNL